MNKTNSFYCGAEAIIEIESGVTDCPRLKERRAFSAIPGRGSTSDKANRVATTALFSSSELHLRGGAKYSWILSSGFLSDQSSFIDLRPYSE